MNDRVHAHVQSTPLVVEHAVDFVTDERAGGIAVFIGTTRRYTDGRETLTLYYEAYEEMAVSEIRKLAEHAINEYALERVYVTHRLGEVAFGEASVLIAASSPHRDEAFKACRWLIDNVKSQVPIWKKEQFADGGHEWVKGTLPRLADRGATSGSSSVPDNE